MGGITDILTQVRRAKAAILSELQAEALRAGADAAAVVENRIVSTGKTAEGRRLSPYSTTPVPAFFFLGRSRNNKGEKAIQGKAKRREPVSYREFRQLNGLNVTHKNLEFTGEVWQGFGVTGAKVLRTGVVEVTIGGKNERTRTLLGYHSEREKTEITSPSRAEIAQIKAGIVSRLQKIIDRYV